MHNTRAAISTGPHAEDRSRPYLSAVRTPPKPHPHHSIPKPYPSRASAIGVPPELGTTAE